LQITRFKKRAIPAEIAEIMERKSPKKVSPLSIFVPKRKVGLVIKQTDKKQTKNVEMSIIPIFSLRNVIVRITVKIGEILKIVYAVEILAYLKASNTKI